MYHRLVCSVPHLQLSSLHPLVVEVTFSSLAMPAGCICTVPGSEAGVSSNGVGGVPTTCTAHARLPLSTPLLLLHLVTFALLTATGTSVSFYTFFTGTSVISLKALYCSGHIFSNARCPSRLFGPSIMKKSKLVTLVLLP